jgi:AraC-like DNA-binding protein
MITKIIAKSCLILAFLPIHSSSWAESDPVSWAKDTIAGRMDNGLWLVDSNSRLSAYEVWTMGERRFRPLAELKQPFPKEGALWAKFRIPAAAPGDTSRRFIFHDAPLNEFTLFFWNEGTPDSIRAGNQTPYHLLSFKDNFMAIPLPENVKGEQTVLLKFNNFDLNPVVIKGLFLLRSDHQEETIRNVYHENRKANDLYFFTFFGIIGFLLLLFALQWAGNRDKAILYYCLYLAVVGLYYLQVFETQQFYFRPFFKYFASLHSNLQILFSFASYILYLKFVDAFLDFPQRQPRILKVMNACSIIFLAAIPSLWTVQAIWDISVMEWVFAYLRFCFFAVAFYYIGFVWIKSNYRLAVFIFTGSLFLIIGALMGLLDDIFGGDISKEESGIWGRYVSPGKWIIPVYDFKIGVLLEVCVFSLGIGYKQKSLRDEHRRLRAQLERTQTEKQALESRMDLAGAPEKKYPFPTNSSFIRKAVSEVEARLSDETFGVSELAAALNMGRHQLFRKMKETVQLTPIKFIRVIRLWEARRLLASDHLSVSQVAYSVGFGNASYFAKLFKEEFGYLPGKRRGVVSEGRAASGEGR